MKKLLLIVAFISYANSFAQSADLDREYFKVSYVKLPETPILENDKRTYSINLRGVAIEGFSRVNNPGTLDINYNFSGTTITNAKIDKIKHEKKDKDGNVISTSYTYKAKARFTSSAGITVINALTKESYNKAFQESSDYVSDAFSSYYKAERHYANNKYDIKNNHASKHRATIKNRVKAHLNDKYGYVPYSENKYLWILGSKRHPEYAKHHEAFQKVKEAFEKMKYDEPTDKIAEELEPVIAYFNDVIPRYQGKKRKLRKVRYASYYNIAKMYYYLDMPEKTKEYAQKIIDNDYDKSDGKYLIKSAENLIETLKRNQMTSRHMEVLTEDLRNEEEIAEVVEEEQPKESKISLELQKAYLISAKNDTLLVNINNGDISKIGYTLKTVQLDSKGELVGVLTKNASNCKEVLFIDGTRYKNIKFKESSVKSGSLDLGQAALGGASGKLCKVLFESDKIGLYKFKNKELVILPTGSEKGKSTSGMSFVFGFNKNLAKLAKDCPSVAQKAKSKAYKNIEESLVKFCEELTNCQGDQVSK